MAPDDRVAAGLLAQPVATAPQTHADRVFAEIERAIVTGEFAPHSRLGEEALAARFGVSRGPLREALRRLEGRGLVVRLPHAGVRVVSLTRTDLVELYEIRANLEGLACRLATQRMTGEEIDALEALLQRHANDEHLRLGESYFQEHGAFDFHFVIARLSRSRRLEQLLCHDYYSLTRMLRFRTRHKPGRPQQAYKDHLRIWDALRERDADLAEILMRRHVEAARRELEEMNFSDTSDAAAGGR
jgi:DNA-binding GntR family transcriptional regulator